MVNIILRNVKLAISNTQHYHLIGNIYNDERFEDGTLIVTSRIISVFFEEENLYITTKTGNNYFVEDYRSSLSEEDIKILQETFMK